MSEEPEGAPGGEGASGREPAERRRLDPDRAVGAARRQTPRPREPVVDTRRYQRIIGLFGLTLVVVVFVSFLLTRGVGTAGIPPGKVLDRFAAPLAISNLNGVANLHPTCSPSKHDPRALNVCLLVKQAPLVLGFFVTAESGCERIVTAMQTVARQFPQVQFAAVAVHASHGAARRAVRAHHWTIPVAYDQDGAVGQFYGIEVCPIVELAYRGGVVARRLIGKTWNSSAALAGQVRALVAGQPR